MKIFARPEFGNFARALALTLINAAVDFDSIH